MRIAQLIERADLIAAHVTSLFDRADAFERVANELRTEAAAATHDVLVLRKELERRISRSKVRARISVALSEARSTRRAS